MDNAALNREGKIRKKNDHRLTAGVCFDGGEAGVWRREGKRDLTSIRLFSQNFLTRAPLLCHKMKTK